MPGKRESMEAVRPQLQEAAALVAAASASPALVTTLQATCATVWKRLARTLYSAESQSAARAVTDRHFALACLTAQELPWPDAACRLRIVEDAVGSLNECDDAALRQAGCPARVCAGLAALEDLLSEHADAKAVSGVLDSYGLLLVRLLQQAEDASSDYEEACEVLARVLQRQDLEDYALDACIHVMCAYGATAYAGQHPLKAEAHLARVCLTVMDGKRLEASAYLRAQEAYARLVGERETLEAIAALRCARRRWTYPGEAGGQP